MVKYYSKNGKEVVLGDYINVAVNVDTPFGEKVVIVRVTVDEKSIEILKKGGYITIKEEINADSLPFVKEFAINAGVPIETAINIMDSFIENGDYIIALYLLLKTACSLDRNDALIDNKERSYVIFNFHTGKSEWVAEPRPCDIVFSSEWDGIMIVKKLSSLIKAAYGEK